MQRHQLLRLAASALLTLLAGPVIAQSDRPLSLVVGYSAGGSADLVARVVGAEMAKRLNRQVIIENVPGASGMLAVQKVLGGAADGGMVYMGGTDTVLVPMINSKVKLDWSKDLEPVGRMTTLPMVLAVPAASPHQSLGDLILALRKGGANSFNFGTPGIGTMQHLFGSLIVKQARVPMVHVPYRGGAQILNDLVGGTIDSAVLVLSTAMPQLKEGKIRAVSVSDSARVPQLPAVKAIGEEEGLQGNALPLWQGLFVKAGTSASVTSAYEKALMETMASPEVRTKLAESGITAAPLSGAAFGAFIRPQATLYRDIVKSAQISLD